MIKINRVLIAAFFLFGATISQAASTVLKPADLGPYWQPISTSSSYVYADSFIAPESGSATNLGAFLLLNTGTTAPNIRFEVWGDNNGPDASNVIASTGSLTLAVDATLTFFDAPVAVNNAPMSVGVIYWFVATVVGEDAADGKYRVGGHTQNSTCNDDGTFWYSNAADGVNFNGLNLTPEMAFEVQINGGGEQACGTLAPIPFVAVPTLDNAGLLLLMLLAGISGMLILRAREV